MADSHSDPASPDAPDGASDGGGGGEESLSYRDRYAEVDVDRGAAVGAAIGVAMFVVIQGMIVLAFQTGLISGDVGLLAPLALSGVTQLVYVFPTALFFVNRRCPLMTKGFLAVAGAVFVLSLFALAG